MSVCMGAEMVVGTVCGDDECLEVRVGMCRGSALGPLFVHVLVKGHKSIY